MNDINRNMLTLINIQMSQSKTNTCQRMAYRQYTRKLRQKHAQYKHKNPADYNWPI